VADDLHAVPLQPESVHRDDACQYGHQRRGYYRRDPAQHQHHGQRAQADHDRQPLRLAQVTDQVPELAEEVTFPLAHPQELRDLADDDGQRQADDESLEHGLGDEVRHESQPQQPCGQRQQPGGEGQRHRQRREHAGFARGDVSDRGRRQRRGRGHRPDNQVAAQPASLVSVQ
jgi:hypothetical protein